MAVFFIRPGDIHPAHRALRPRDGAVSLSVSAARTWARARSILRCSASACRRFRSSLLKRPSLLFRWLFALSCVLPRCTHLLFSTRLCSLLLLTAYPSRCIGGESRLGRSRSPRIAQLLARVAATAGGSSHRQPSCWVCGGGGSRFSCSNSPLAFHLRTGWWRGGGSHLAASLASHRPPPCYGGGGGSWLPARGCSHSPLTAHRPHLRAGWWRRAAWLKPLASRLLQSS